MMMGPYILSCMAPELNGCARIALAGALGNLSLERLRLYFPEKELYPTFGGIYLHPKHIFRLATTHVITMLVHYTTMNIHILWNLYEDPN